MVDLRELGCVHQDDLLVDVGDWHVLQHGQASRDQPLLDLLKHVTDVQDDLVPLQRDRPRAVQLHDPHERLLRSCLRGQPQVGEPVRGDERADLPLDQAVDPGRERSDQSLQPRTVGQHLREHVVEDGLDVDLLLEGLDSGGPDRLLHLCSGSPEVPPSRCSAAGRSACGRPRTPQPPESSGSRRAGNRSRPTPFGLGSGRPVQRAAARWAALRSYRHPLTWPRRAASP